MNLLRREPFIALCLACLCIRPWQTPSISCRLQVIGGIDGTAAQAIQRSHAISGQGRPSGQAHRL
jgi:hypothetical protein